MKVKIVIILFILAVVLAGCSLTNNSQPAANDQLNNIAELLQVENDGRTNFNKSALNQLVPSQSGGVLSQAEVEGIKFMFEEEKLAKDVYSALAGVWGQQVFENIAGSETTHQSAVADLAAAYGVDVSALSEGAGEFINQELQKLYDDLVEKGSLSLQDAYEVGAAIEEIDIIDLEEYMQATDNTDILLVYENLQRGSRNHLRAFVRNMERQGNTYQAQYLDNADYQEIINGDVERGGTNQRSGWGRGSGQGNGNSNRGNK